MKPEDPTDKEAEALRAKEQALKWPDCLSPEESRKSHYYSGGYGYSLVTPTSGRTDLPYKRTEVSPGRWQWVEDKEAEQQFAADCKHRDELLFAIKTRPLTDEEEGEVARLGENILAPMHPWWGGAYWSTYSEKERRQELLDLYFQQYRLKAARTEAAKHAAGCDHAIIEQRPKP